MFTYLMIGLGGAVGAIARVTLNQILPLTVMGIPFSIMCINVIGCFSMGVLSELMALHWSLNPQMKYFIVSGFLGSFTTFSAFSLEFGVLIEKALYLNAFIYVSVSILLTLIFFLLGLKLIKLIY